jgi:hypothetical protein
MNIFAWVITISGTVAFFAAATAIIYVLLTPGSLIVASDTTLHDSYYIIVHAKTTMLSLVLGMILSASVALLGYSHTERYFRQMIGPAVQHAHKT